MSIDLAVVPVAGRGTRLLPLTKSQPKEMLAVGRLPVVQYVAEELHRCAIHRLIFVTGPGKAAIENHFDTDNELIAHLRETGKEEILQDLSFEREDLEYFYTRQRQQLGLGHAVLCAKPLVGGQNFVVALGDSILGVGAQSQVVRTMVEQFEQEEVDAVIAFEDVPRKEVIHYGIAKPKGEPTDIFELADLVEKPDVEEAPSQLAVAARYVFSAKIFDCLEQTHPGKNGEIQLTDAIRLLIQEGGRVLGVRWPQNEKRYDIGSYERYFEAFAEFALADPDYGPAFRTAIEKLL